jgi:hypothetical protein
MEYPVGIGDLEKCEKKNKNTSHLEKNGNLLLVYVLVDTLKMCYLYHRGWTRPAPTKPH